MWYFIVSLVVVILDQALKKYMSSILTLCVPGRCESIEILPVFQFTLLHNTGAAFSFLADEDGWQRWFLVGVSTVVGSVIAIWLYRIRHTEKLLAAALSMILGGAVGNLIDRIHTGYVVDFIVVHYERWFFPAFNIADSAITIGAGLLILDVLLKPKSTGEAVE